MGRVVVVGSVNTDLVVRVPRFPQPGETLVANAFAIYGGGKGANQAIAAARCGAKVNLVAAVGDDPFSRDRLRDLANDQVDITYVQKRPGLVGGVAVIHVTANGENAISIVPGANATLSPDDTRTVFEQCQCSAPDVLCAQLEVPASTVAEALRQARARGMPTILNATPASAMQEELWALSDVLVVNHGEALQLSGLSTDDPAVLGRTLQARGPQVVILTLGEHGALLCLPQACMLISAPAVPVVDTTAAGDAFVGVLAALRSEGWSWEQIVPWAVWAGALAVQRPGAQPSLPHRGEIAAALERHPLACHWL